jgi:hypothetical protein
LKGDNKKICNKNCDNVCTDLKMYTRNPVILHTDMNFMYYFWMEKPQLQCRYSHIRGNSRDIFAMAPQYGGNSDCSRHNKEKVLNKGKAIRVTGRGGP